MKLLQTAWETVLDALFPKRERIAALEKLSVDELLNLLPPASLPPGGDGIFPLFDYHNERVRTIVWEIKYRHNRRLIGRMAELLHQEMLESASDFASMGGLPPLLVPIPTSAARRRERGGSQTELLAEAIAKMEIGSIAEYAPNALMKVRETESQTALSRAKRLRNLVGTFEADKVAVSGRDILLLDDVVTTGATIAEAKRALREAGAGEILSFAISH
ncbi:MAG TPA: hypothetical protein VHF05_02685 [Candidatus Paceibacterota bacterium]|nr:hypothetical protein [Candidatus Paceibacterota bacterium]